EVLAEAGRQELEVRAAVDRADHGARLAHPPDPLAVDVEGADGVALRDRVQPAPLGRGGGRGALAGAEEGEEDGGALHQSLTLMPGAGKPRQVSRTSPATRAASPSSPGAG